MGKPSLPDTQLKTEKNGLIERRARDKPLASAHLEGGHIGPPLQKIPNIFEMDIRNIIVVAFVHKK
jgi:hypothetical protein